MRFTPIRAPGRIPAVVGAVVLVVVALATSVEASHAYVEISIPIDTFVNADEDSKTQLATADVPDGFAGHMCEVAAHSENQESVHPGNDLIVESGTSQVILADVESEPGRIVEAAELLELDEVITVSLLMGPHGLFSAGIEVTVECFEEEPTTTTTTTAAEVSPTVVTTTTLPETTTTAAVIDTEVSTTQSPTSPSVADEVLGTEVLPFTGVESHELAMLGLALLACGALIVAGTRRADN